MIAIGIILYIGELRWRRRNPRSEDRLTPVKPDPDMVPQTAEKCGDETAGEADGEREESSESSECCGLHLVCEKDSLSPMSAEIIYYDDEELDRFIGREATGYTPEEEEEFRDVLLTLLPEDVPGWARSITQRRIELPPDIRDELFLLINEGRARQPGQASRAPRAPV